MKKNKILLICLVSLLGLSLLTACRSKDDKKKDKISDTNQEILLPKDDLDDEEENKESGSGAINAGTQSEDNSTTGSVNEASSEKQEQELPKDNLEDEEEDKDTSVEDSNTSDDIRLEIIAT